MRQLVDGVKFIHRNGIIHCDLKLGNVFVDWMLTLRIGDFGSALRYDRQSANANGEVYAPNRGTITYLAPESISRGMMSYKTDIWAIAVMAYNMRLGLSPFRGVNFEHTCKRIKDIEYR